MHLPRFAMSLLTAAALAAPLGAAEPVHPELGTVTWNRDFDAALATAKKEGKPVFALFQEVPGCAGCQQFGARVLSNPTLVKVIEGEFVPVAVFNNRGGKDREILERYQEPAWNYQVVRFLDASGQDILPRKDRVWTLPALAARMVEALEAARRPVPAELRQLAKGGTAHLPPRAARLLAMLPAQTAAATRPAETKTAAFAMYCFWDGEAKLGRVDGVLTTEAGWLDGREVVKVTYDPGALAWTDLVKTAEKVDCAHRIHAPGAAELAAAKEISRRTAVLYQPDGYRKAKESDQKRVLRASPLRQLSLTPEQATKVNAALRFGTWADLQKILTAEQLEEARRLAGR